MPQSLPMKSLFYGMIRPIGALAAILELIEYVEPLTFWQAESSPNIGQKKVIVYIVSNLYVKHPWVGQMLAWRAL